MVFLLDNCCASAIRRYAKRSYKKGVAVQVPKCELANILDTAYTVSNIIEHRQSTSGASTFFSRGARMRDSRHGIAQSFAPVPEHCTTRGQGETVSTRACECVSFHLGHVEFLVVRSESRCERTRACECSSHRRRTWEVIVSFCVCHVCSPFSSSSFICSFGK